MSVSVCTPVKNCAFWIDAFLSKLDEFKDVNRVIFSYGESYDPTLLILKNWMKKTNHKVELYQEPKMNALSSAQIGAIYQDFQELIGKGDDAWVLLADADLTYMPPDLIQRLQVQDKDIIAPYVWMRNCIPKMFYDSYVFRLNGSRYHPLDPPMLGGKTGKLDSVGTCFLIKRKVFLDVPYGDPYPHLKFCNDARAKGYTVWADPTISVTHVDLTRFGINHLPIESILNPGKPVILPPFINNKGELKETHQFEDELINAWVYGV